jgi:hypothetical protein
MARNRPRLVEAALSDPQIATMWTGLALAVEADMTKGLEASLGPTVLTD